MGSPVAQVLLTHADLADRTRANNARAALGALLEAGAVPILNENDSVAVEEIKFGDNDQLAAMVTPLVDADLLILLSDVEGLLDAKGARVSRGARRRRARRSPRCARARAGARSGRAGWRARSKRRVARRSRARTSVVADARAEGILESILGGRGRGDAVSSPAKGRLSAKKYWIAFTLRPEGALVLDRGAAEAVRGKGRSILPVGVLGVRGSFGAGDAVRVLDAEGAEIGRGLARCASEDAARMAGKAREELTALEREIEVLVHRDELVVWQ